MKKIGIRFSSNKLKRAIYTLKKVKDRLNKGVIFDIFTPKKATYLKMDKPLLYNVPSSVSSNSSSIPFVLYKTGEPEEENLPQEIKDLFKKIQKENINLKIQYFSDKGRLDFIKNHFNKEVSDAYQKLKPGAYRADLFRYCVLYINGGIYGDLTQTYLEPLSKFIDLENDEIVLVRDYLGENQKTNGIYNAFIASQRRNHTLKIAIDKIVENVQLKNYGINSLDPSGPYLFRRALQEYKGNYKLNLELNPFNHKMIRNIRTGKGIIITKLPNHDKLIGKNKSTDYHELWVNKDIFID